MRCCKFFENTIVLWLAAILVSCGGRGEYVSHQGFTEGTTYKISYSLAAAGESYEEDILQLLQRFSESLSTYIPTSLISRINRNVPDVEIDDYFRTVFMKSAEVNRASSGAFDITVAPIVNLWGFGFTSDAPDINPAKIDSLLQFVGMDKVRIVGNKVVKDSPGVMLDVNAIAKGYSVDVVADFLKSKGCKNYLVEIGGEIVARGVNASGNPWRVGIDRPADHAVPGQDLQAIVTLDNKALATSGNYRRFFERDGVKYSHSIDVKTGYPVSHNLLSVTIVADDCITADAWATVCMVSGLDKTRWLLADHPELDALLIYSDSQGDYQIEITKGLESAVSQ
ncbi:MAG: FAD:protein FMN transferase [Bacteroidales bacterium]|jgi:thiamine biosynthesis lipoprotein|nr:FAD:protein FMN transferase [Bacteroidales bacterium]